MRNYTVLADELGALETELAPLKAKIARAEALRSAIRTLFISAPAAEAHVAYGVRYAVKAGPMGFVSFVDRAALVKEIGLEKYCEIAVPTLSAIEKHCGQMALVVCTGKVQNGPRPLTISPLEAPAPESAAVAKPATKTKAVAPKKKAA